MSDAMNDGLWGTAQERRFRAEKPKKVAKKKKVVKKKPVKKVEPKSERRVSREVRYFIFERSEKGKLHIPLERKPYDYEDSSVFNDWGYDSQEVAFAAIEQHLLKEDDHHNELGWDRTFFDNGKTNERKESYFVIPQLTVKTWWEKVD